ncbi:MAG: transcription termination/antitermination protein NusG [Gaiellales bacterium]
MFHWYVINTYSGHENKVKANLEHRIVSMGQQMRFRRVVVPTEQVIETKDGQKVQTEKRVLPGYVLVNMDLNDEAWTVVKGTPGVTAFVGAGAKPSPLSTGEVERILHASGGGTPGAAGSPAAKAQVEFTLGESVKVTSGPLSDFDGEIVDVNPDQQKLKVLVDIFERQVPVELGFDQVKKID